MISLPPVSPSSIVSGGITSTATGQLESVKAALVSAQTQLNTLTKKFAEAQAVYAAASAKATAEFAAAQKMKAPFGPPGQKLEIIPPNPQSLVKTVTSAASTIQGATKLIPDASSITSMVPGGAPFVPKIPSMVSSTTSTEVPTTQLESSTIFKKFVS